MIHKTPSPLHGHVRVVFELPSCVWADRIFLVGDFNGWDEHSTPMRQDRDGVWRTTLDLAYGEQCEFRYLIDGQWKTDYHADSFSSNGFGSENSIVQAILPDETWAVKRSLSRIHESAAPEPAKMPSWPANTPARTIWCERALRSLPTPLPAAA
jgi:1,4-alpha-glucan branching enzyme